MNHKHCKKCGWNWWSGRLSCPNCGARYRLKWRGRIVVTVADTAGNLSLLPPYSAGKVGVR